MRNKKLKFLLVLLVLTLLTGCAGNIPEKLGGNRTFD